MNKEKYETAEIDVHVFEAEDVITTSGGYSPEFKPNNPWEMPNEP